MTFDDAALRPLQERITQLADDMDKAAAGYCLPFRIALPLHAVAQLDQLQAQMRVDWDQPTRQPQPQTLHIAGYTGPAPTSPNTEPEL